MDDKEKLQFLKKMGFSVSRLTEPQDTTKRREPKDNRVDKSELQSLARIFNIRGQTRQQSLSEFLTEQGLETEKVTHADSK